MIVVNACDRRGDITLAYTTHRPEALPGLMRLMEGSDAVFLEEPPTLGFQEMIAGERSIQDYLPFTETEYPEFTRRMCGLLRRLCRAGCRLIQSEPYVERLIAIHDRLADGESPRSLAGDPILGPVYQAEKRATAALLHFYKAAAAKGFEETVAAVLFFARTDATRFRLRDRMRARAIAADAGRYRRVCVEAGMMHLFLYAELRRRANDRYRTDFRFVQSEAAQAIWGKRHAYGPGDRLTLMLIFHPRLPDAALIPDAARALIYNKLLIKDEMLSAPGSPCPHLTNEIAAISAVRRLSFADCRMLYDRIRMLSPDAAMAEAARFMNRSC